MEVAIWMVYLVLTLAAFHELVRREGIGMRCRECGRLFSWPMAEFCSPECGRIWNARQVIAKIEVERKRRTGMPQELKDFLAGLSEEQAASMLKWMDLSDFYEEMVMALVGSHPELAGNEEGAGSGM